MITQILLNIFFNFTHAMDSTTTFILQRDFIHSNGLIRAIPINKKISRSLTELKKNKESYGKKDDTSPVKKYFHSLKDNSQEKFLAISIINEHMGAINLTIEQLKEKIQKK